MQRILIILVIGIAALGFTSSGANAGLVVTIESDAGGGPVVIPAFPAAGPNATASSLLSFGLGFTLPGFTSVSVTVTSSQTPSLSQVTDVSLDAVRDSSVGTVTLTLTSSNDDFTLPAGTPLRLESRATGLMTPQSLTFDSTFTDADGPPQSTPTIAFTGLGIGISPQIAIVDRDTPSFELSNVLVLSVVGAGSHGLANATTTISAIPEAGSFVAWGICAALCGLVVFARRRGTLNHLV